MSRIESMRHLYIYIYIHIYIYALYGAALRCCHALVVCGFWWATAVSCSTEFLIGSDGVSTDRNAAPLFHNRSQFHNEYPPREPSHIPPWERVNHLQTYLYWDMLVPSRVRPQSVRATLPVTKVTKGPKTKRSRIAFQTFSGAFIWVTAFAVKLWGGCILNF